MTRDEKLILDIVAALSAHYEERAEAIAERSVSRRVRMEYIYINSRIFEATAEIVGAESAKAFIYDIGNKIGYAKTDIDWFSETAYKHSKYDIKRNIARKLNLMD